jgi:hypothetical protein
MGAFRLLFSIRVIHGYFGDRPERCRLAFQPDEATGRWLRGAGCLPRASSNTLQVLYAVGDRAVTGRPRPGESFDPVTLRFDVKATDPLFSLYTDCDPDPIASDSAGSMSPARLAGVSVFERRGSDSDTTASPRGAPSRPPSPILRPAVADGSASPSPSRRRVWAAARIFRSKSAWPGRLRTTGTPLNSW